MRKNYNNLKIKQYIKSEKELSSAYLRIRKLVNSWDTKMGGINRFKLTEQKIRSMKIKLSTYENLLSSNNLEKIIDTKYNEGIVEIAKAIRIYISGLEDNYNRLYC